MTVLACASHFLIDMPLFGAPVLFVIGAVLMIRRSERRRFAAPESAEPGAADRAVPSTQKRIDGRYAPAGSL